MDLTLNEYFKKRVKRLCKLVLFRIPRLPQPIPVPQRLPQDWASQVTITDRICQAPQTVFQPAQALRVLLQSTAYHQVIITAIQEIIQHYLTGEFNGTAPKFFSTFLKFLHFLAHLDNTVCHHLVITYQ